MREPSKTSVTVAIATCARPEGLRAALESIATQQVEGSDAPTIRVAVVDNHRDATARAVFEDMAASFPFSIAYEAEPQPGISFARNRLVRMASGSDYIAFLDDDETAEAQWLSELLRVARDGAASVVLGPVLSRLEGAHADWMEPLLQRMRRPDGSQVDTRDFRTGNVLLKMDALAPISGPFHPAFALIGGSDTLLGFQLARRGHRFLWADRALVTETMPGARVQPQWYLRRRHRSGFVYARVQMEIHGIFRGAPRGLYRGLGTAAYGVLGTLRALPRGRLARLRALGDVAYGAGSLAGLFGRIRPEYAGRSQS